MEGCRQPFAWILLILGLVLAPFAVTAVWLRNTIFITDRFVETLAPLSTNPAIVDSVSTDITEELFQEVNVEQRVGEALPQQAVFLAPAIAAQLHSFVQDEAQQIISSERFNQIWTEALRRAHPKVIQVLGGGGEVLIVQSGTVTLDVGAAVDLVKNELNQRGITIFNNVSTDREIVLFQSERLARLQQTLNIIADLGVALPIITLLLLLAAILISLNKIKFVIVTGIGLALAMIVLLLVLPVVKQQFVEGAVEFTPEGAQAIYTTITRFLQQAAVAVLFMGLVIAGGTYFLFRLIRQSK
jgi:hypothetical protein